MSDRSLDEFASASVGSDESVDDADDAATKSDTDNAATKSDTDNAATKSDTDADPSVPTMRWSADGAACDACGAVVSRRWNDGDDFVCADCKVW